MRASLDLTRRSVMGCGLAALTASQAIAQPAASIPKAMPCADFLSMVGVNTHLRYARTQYNDVSAVIAAIEFVGFKFARDVAPDRQAPNSAHYAALASAGIAFCLFWGPRRAMGDAIQQVAALEAAHPGAVSNLEGPNEITPRFAYADLTGIDAGRKFIGDMRVEAARNPQLRHKPLVNFTSFRPAASDCDFANQHPYPKDCQQPADKLESAWEKNVGPGGVMPGKPMMFTEFGYHTLIGSPARPAQWPGVDEERQAIMLINGCLDCARIGLSRVYIYQLMDGQADQPGAADQGNHFGLYRLDGSPKRAAMAFKTLFTLLGDQGPRARVSAAPPIEARVVLPGGVECLALRRSSGRQVLIFWNERPVWDKRTAAPLTFAPVLAAVHLPAPRPMSVIDILEPGRAVELGPAASANVAVGAHPIAVQVG